MSAGCFICGEQNQNVLERHHILPRRYGGEDNQSNMVTLCANCHRAVERLYDDSFFRELGLEPENGTGGQIPDGAPVRDSDPPAQPTEKVISVIDELSNRLSVSEQRRDLQEEDTHGWVDRGNSSARAGVPRGEDVVWVTTGTLQDVVAEQGYDDKILGQLSKEMVKANITYGSTKPISVSVDGERELIRCYPFDPTQLRVDF